MLKKILLSCFAIFALTFLLSSNSYAVSDLVKTYDNSFPYSSDVICSDSCSSYKYLYVESNLPYNGSSPYLSASYGGITSAFQLRALPVLYNFESYTGSDSFSYLEMKSINNIPSGVTITVTLSENNPAGGVTPEGSLSITSNGTYDVTNYASAVVNIDSELPPYSELVVDSFWQYHTAFGGAVVAIIAIFLVYRVIRGRLR